MSKCPKEASRNLTLNELIRTLQIKGVFSQVLNRTVMVPRGPSFGIGSAHAQNAPANSRYACSSATKGLQIHAAQCVALHRLRVDACSNEERAVSRTRINSVPAPRRVY